MTDGRKGERNSNLLAPALVLGLVVVVGGLFLLIALVL